MQYAEDRHHLQVEIQADGCQIPQDELARMQRLLEPVGEAVQGLPSSELFVQVHRHPRQDYHVKARLKVPGRTLVSGDCDPFLDSAFQRCVRKLTRKVCDYAQNPERGAVNTAEKLTAIERDVMMPEERDAGPLGHSYRAGDYRGFRTGLSSYEDWVRKRVGRWLQRYPQAETRVGDGLRIGDVVEEVFLNAFERFGQRPVDVPFNQWLDGLIDPSVKVILRHPDEEGENARLARTLRDAAPISEKARIREENQ
jgi:hypothetical protein